MFQVRSYLQGSTDDTVAMIVASELLESNHGAKFIEWGKNFTKLKFPCNKVEMMIFKSIFWKQIIRVFFLLYQNY